MLSFTMWINLLCYQRVKIKYCVKVGILETGTEAILTYEEVTKELGNYCKRWRNGEILRGNDLGVMKINSKIGEELITTVNTSLDQHSIVRPIYDKILGVKSGKWTKELIFNHASYYLETFCQSGTSFKVKIPSISVDYHEFDSLHLN